MRKGEPIRKIAGKKRTYKDNVSTNTLGSEKVTNIKIFFNNIIINILLFHFLQMHMKSQLRIVTDKVDKKLKGDTNSLAPYEGIIPDAPSESFRQKKGKGKIIRGGDDRGGNKKKKIMKS